MECKRTVLHFAIDGIFIRDRSQHASRDIIMTLIKAYEGATKCTKWANHLPIDSLLCRLIPKGHYNYFDVILTLIRLYITEYRKNIDDVIFRVLEGELIRCERMAQTQTPINVDILSSYFKIMREGMCGEDFYKIDEEYSYDTEEE